MISYLLPQRAATVESLGHPASGIIGWGGDIQNTSGVSVTESTALTFAAVWCAVRVISETLATLPCILYRRTSDDGRERAVDDPRYNLIHDSPHPLMSSVTFFETMTAAMVLRGNCFAKIVRKQSNAIDRLELRMPDQVHTPELVGEKRIVYRCSDPEETIDGEDMLHIAGLGGDGITGWSVIKYGAQNLGRGMAGDQYVASQMGNGATPKGILKFPTRLLKEHREQFRREWEEQHRGTANAGRVAILHGGMDYLPISMTNEDAQLLQILQVSVRDVARWFRLPPHMLADLADSSVRANIEQQAMEFITYSMAPWLVRWEQGLNRKLLTPEEREDGMYFEFLLDSLLRGDVPSRFTAYATARQWGWMSVNDIRRRENMNLIDGGDVYLQPSNMVPADSDMAKGEKPDPPPPPMINGPPPAEDPEPEEDDDEPPPEEDGRAMLLAACNDLVRSHLRTLQRVERAEVTKASKMTARGRNFVEWLETWYAEYEQMVADRLAGPVAAWEKVTQSEPGVATLISAGICARHTEQLLSAADGQPEAFADRVQTIMETWVAEIDGLTLEGVRHVA